MNYYRNHQVQKRMKVSKSQYKITTTDHFIQGDAYAARETEEEHATNQLYLKLHNPKIFIVFFMIWTSLTKNYESAWPYSVIHHREI